MLDRLDELEKRYDQHFKVVFDAIRMLMGPSPTKQKAIGFRPTPRSEKG